MDLDENELKDTLTEIKEIKKIGNKFYDMFSKIDEFMEDNIYLFEDLVKKEIKRVQKENKESDE